jgi:hypothetical protein
VLDLRALDRALLARQHLLERVDRPVADEVEHPVGLRSATLAIRPSGALRPARRVRVEREV